jgi:DNA-binding NarL/FixJ family response regulator
MASVVICDPPSALRQVLAQRVGSVPGISRVEVVDDLELFSPMLAEWAPDVLLVASRFSDGGSAPAIRRIHRQAPGLRMLLLTMGTDPDDILAGMDAGALGYLARDAALPEVAAALALVPLEGGGPRSSAYLDEEESSEPDAELTERELQVLEGMSRGRSNGEIGEELFLSEDTIKTHARRLFRKMNVNDRAHAVAQGFRRGLLG